MAGPDSNTFLLDLKVLWEPGPLGLVLLKQPEHG